MVNILRLTVAYLNATINVKPETQNQRSEPTGLAKPGETRGLTGTGPGLARQESAGGVFGRFWNRTDPFLQSKPGPLAGYPDPLLTLARLIQCGSLTRWRKRFMASPRMNRSGSRRNSPSIRSSLKLGGRQSAFRRSGYPLNNA